MVVKTDIRRAVSPDRTRANLEKAHETWPTMTQIFSFFSISEYAQENLRGMLSKNTLPPWRIVSDGRGRLYIDVFYFHVRASVGFSPLASSFPCGRVENTRFERQTVSRAATRQEFHECLDGVLCDTFQLPTVERCLLKVHSRAWNPLFIAALRVIMNDSVSSAGVVRIRE